MGCAATRERTSLVGQTIVFCGLPPSARAPFPSWVPDTNHKNHIGWTTPEELRERLYRRVRNSDSA